jgi:RNA polymerase sigma factor (sigma-70 family)
MVLSWNRKRWSDQQLLAGIATRDAEAFRVFYRRHVGVVLAFLLRETGDPEAAADALAEVFAAVLIAAVRYEPRHESAVPWLFGIARNVLGASRRRGRVDAKARRRLGFEPLALEAMDLERIHAVADLAGRLEPGLLDSLPEHERQALYARVVEERDYSDIAEQLECSELVVRKRVSRGLSRLRDEWKERS